jgi:hypothetical protein
MAHRVGLRLIVLELPFVTGRSESEAVVAVGSPVTGSSRPKEARTVGALTETIQPYGRLFAIRPGGTGLRQLSVNALAAISKERRRAA